MRDFPPAAFWQQTIVASLESWHAWAVVNSDKTREFDKVAQFAGDVQVFITPPSAPQHILGALAAHSASFVFEPAVLFPPEVVQ